MTPKDNLPPPPKGKGKGPFAKLTPKQKKYLLVGGAAAILALIYLLSKRGAPAEGEGEQEQARSAAFGVPAGGEADAGGAFAAQSAGVVDALGQVGDQLANLGTGQADLATGQQDLGIGQQELGSAIGEGFGEAAGERDQLLGAVMSNAQGIRGLQKQYRRERERRRKRQQQKRQRRKQRQRQRRKRRQRQHKPRQHRQRQHRRHRRHRR